MNCVKKSQRCKQLLFASESWTGKWYSINNSHKLLQHSFLVRYVNSITVINCRLYFQWSNDGSQFLCLCDGSIKSFDVINGKVSSVCNSSLSEDSTDEDIILTFGISEDNSTIVTYHKSGLFKSWKWKGMSDIFL